jgi:S1-C subfamily serine protease
MRRAPLYSRAPRAYGPSEVPDAGAPLSDPGPRAGRLRRFVGRHDRALWAGAGVVVTLAGVALWAPAPPLALTQADIDAAVLQTLQTQSLPSPAARAYERVRPSVVRVRSLERDDAQDTDIERAVGSGVVVMDDGKILTNLHVVAHGGRIGLVCDAGGGSGAEVLSTQPGNDLAVVQARALPGVLVPATLRATHDLAPGDQVAAVGYPFGIGPSVSAGVISGLDRAYPSPRGHRLLTHLIQFDAAANPGNSGGPLVTMEGEVVGIVTGILNPTDQSVFIGIGFAVPIENAAGGVGISPF